MAAELEYYKEQLAHGRHIEVQRSTVAGLAATISGAIIGELLKRATLDTNELPYTMTLFAVGATACLLSAKLYERFRLHNEIAKLVRNRLDPGLQRYRKIAEKAIRRKYPFLFWLPLHIIWNSLFGVIALLGLAMTAKILCH